MVGGEAQGLKKRAAVLGHPIDHSLSPALHRFWLKKAELEGDYIALDVADSDAAFAAMIGALRHYGFRGCNVTLPHKRRAFALADEVSAVAQGLGVANMLSFSNKSVVGDNSDVSGFASALTHHATHLPESFSALVLGAGGAVPAVLQALIEAGAQQIYVANRTRARAEKLAQHFSGKLTVLDWARRESVVGAVDLIINATSAGVGTGAGFDFSFAKARPDIVVGDLSYRPLETDFLARAKAHGLTVFNGLSMLVFQAMAGFRQWFGATPGPVDEAIAFLSETLKQPAEKPLLLGLTGSIGMGKSTTARLFAEQGVAIWSADEAVHRLYEKGGAAVGLIKERFPDCVREGAVDRACLSRALAADKEGFVWLEKQVHPLVYLDQCLFVHRQEKAKAILLDIPLLFESENQRRLDAIIVCTADEKVRRERVLARPGMSAEKLDMILARQWAEQDRIDKADYIIRTDGGIEEARAQVGTVLAALLPRPEADGKKG